MVVRRVHQHADLGLKIRRILVRNVMLLLHVDASLNAGGLTLTGLTVQLHSFAFEDCHKSCFNSIQDADPCSTVSLLTPVARLISIDLPSCSLDVYGKNL